MDEFTLHRKKKLTEMRQYVSGESMDGISVSDEDKKLPTLDGGWIARNPANHADQWYVAPAFYAENYEPA